VPGQRGKDIPRRGLNGQPAAGCPGPGHRSATKAPTAPPTAKPMVLAAFAWLDMPESLSVDHKRMPHGNG
jgi:hypothetical protein